MIQLENIVSLEDNKYKIWDKEFSFSTKPPYIEDIQQISTI